MIVQDSRKHFTIHAVVEKDEDMAVLFEKIVGTPVKYEMVHCAKWTQRLLLAEHYQQGRVFIAGDAAHLVIPTGGLGMNTGVGDAIDISWKLAATLQGWGGPKLLPSYEAERRPTGAINVKASGSGTSRPHEMARGLSPEHRGRHAGGQSRAGASAGDRPRRGAEIVPRDRRRARLSLCRLAGDLRRAGRPGADHRGISCRRAGRARACPMSGSKPGELSVHDRIKRWLHAVALRPDKADASGLQKAFGAIGAPFTVLDLDGEAARQVYGFDYLLVRPDLHVVWRGNALPDDPDKVARIVTGH